MNPCAGLRAWQMMAMEAWERASRRGIAAVVTGGGKTRFALACLHKYRNTVPGATSVIVVPTNALLDQWAEEVIEALDLPLSHLTVLNSRSRIRASKIHLGVINTVAVVARSKQEDAGFLIVDECHRAASESFRRVFNLSYDASLGLSATPDRPYDDGLKTLLIPKLGPVLIEYTYREAMADGVIVPFRLRNVVFDLEPELRQKYLSITKAIQASMSKHGAEAPETVALLLRRARLVNSSIRRVEIAAKIIARNRERRTLVFHEDIGACELLGQVLRENGVSSAVYHSRVSMPARVAAIGDFRRGEIGVLIACRALDEGFNVPEADMAIVAASTATTRQRVQRLGRVLRPSAGKEGATIYTIVASEPEIRRLAEESSKLEGVAEVEWSRA